MQGSLAVYGVFILLLLLVALGATAAIPPLALTSAFLLLIGLCLWFVLSAALMTGLVVAQDGCAAAERLIIAEVRARGWSVALHSFVVLEVCRGGRRGLVQPWCASLHALECLSHPCSLPTL